MYMYIKRPVNLLQLYSVNVLYSRRQNKVSVPFALHRERSNNGNKNGDKTVTKTVRKRF